MLIIKKNKKKTSQQRNLQALSKLSKGVHFEAWWRRKSIWKGKYCKRNDLSSSVAIKKKLIEKTKKLKSF